MPEVAGTFGINPAALRQRPYLHLDPATWPRLRQRLADRPSPALLNCRAEARPGPTRLPRAAPAVLEAAAFLAAISDSRGDRQWLQGHLAVSLEPDRAALAGVRRGQYLAAMAFCYDLLADVLEPAVWQALRQTLTEQAERAAEAVRVGFGDDWPRESPQAVATLAGLNLAGLALLGDEPAAAGWLTVTEPRLLELLETVALDGWWPTGFEDWNLLLPLLVRVADAWARLAGRDLFEHGLFQQAWATALHGVVNHGDALDLDRVGQAGRSRRTAAGLPGGFYRWHHEPCQWALDRLAMRFSHSGFRAASDRWRTLGLTRGTPWAVLFEPARTTPAITAGESAYHTFDEHGLAVWRSGWSPQATWVAFATGPAYGAAAGRWTPTTPLDADANHLLLGSGGLLLAGEAGRAGGGDSALHNTVLVDGQGQLPPGSTPRPARLEAAWQTACGAALAGSADGCYPPETGLQQFRRDLLVAPEYVLVWDRLASQRPVHYEWRLQTHGQVRTPADGLPRLEVGPMALVVQPLRPNRLQTEVALTWPPDRSAALTTALRLLPLDTVRQTQFLVLLAPSAAALPNPLTGRLITGDQCVGARLEWPTGLYEEALFPTAGRGIHLAHLLSDAAALALRRQGPGGDWVRLVARQVGRLLIPGSALLRATQAIDVGLTAADGELTGELESRTGATVTLRCPFEPRGVLVDGRNAHARLNRADRLVTLRVPAGRHRLQISSR